MTAGAFSVSLPSRYRALRHIATGGMASVWAAEDERLGRTVAIKVLAEAYAADAGAAERFEREARAAARLSQHPHVVTVYDVGEHDGRPFIVMECFQSTVRDRVRAPERIWQATALRWLRESAAALDAAHAAGIVHRDVKPANLMLDRRERLAVGDFGIALAASDAPLTLTGQVLGTAGYLSPEQAAGHGATDASDRYALAVVAFELLAGRRPFDGRPSEQLRAHVETPPPRASAVAPSLPPALDDVLERGLAKDPAQRPPTAHALVEEVAGALEGRRFAHPGAAAPPPATSATAPTRVTIHRRSRTVPALLILAAIAILLGAGIASLRSPGGGGSRAAATTQRAAKKPSSKPQQPAPAPDPVALNDQGYQLLQGGDPAAAVAPLMQSVQAFRAEHRTGESGYAYALYNLAEALRRSGRPAEAIPYYEERLRISSFERGVVLAGLQAAERAAGVLPAQPPGHDKGGGHGKGHGKHGGD
ncbi:MAG TPA: serine/threonine-protein kinase [Solirubrobacteraceae bacterium]|nr:serine/threonine-protein kinase [Solirubrobacteraceae bacterium]